MILLTGAGGKTGKAVLAALVRLELPVRTLVRTSRQAEDSRKMGAVETFVGNMVEPSTWQRSTEQVQTIYHICPNMHPQEATIGKLARDAASCNGVNHFVYHSVLHPQVRKMPHHWQKLEVEEKLFEAACTVTILQPTAYMDNILAYWHEILSTGTYALPYPTETRLSLIDLKDVAEAAARVIVDPRLAGGMFELCGTLPLTQYEVAGLIGRVLNREIAAREISLSTWEAAARQEGLSNYRINTLLQMFRYYAAFGMGGSTFVAEKILERKTTSLEQFLRRTIGLENETIDE